MPEQQPTVEPEVVAAGEHAVLVRCGSLAVVHDLRRVVLAARLEGVADVVPGWSSLLVVGAQPAAQLAATVRSLVAAAQVAEGAHDPSVPVLELPTTYDGDDLEAVAAELGLTTGEVVRLHAEPTYTVAFLGFVAGFPYLAGLDPRLHVPRLAVPRVRVPAGSVAIAGAQAGVYPSEAPGGWRLLGRTDAVRFDPRLDPPVSLLPGDRVRFVPVTGRAPRSVPAPSPTTAEHASGPPPALRVLAASPGCLVVDDGRRGVAHLGVPRSGAFDRAALALANRLVGNPDAAAGIEAPFGGFELEALVDLTIAVAGADVAATVAGPAGERAVSMRHAQRLRAGEHLGLGRPAEGVRAYVAVRGGLATEVVLGSRSGTPVAPDAQLPVGPTAGLDPPWLDPVPPARHREAVVELVVVAGPDLDGLPPGTLTALCGPTWTVDPASDRTGVRLAGAVVPTTGDGTLPSAGTLPGFVQLLPSGHPVVLGPDAGTTGGYPVAAVVTDRSRDRLAQLRPGEAVRLVRR